MAWQAALIQTISDPSNLIISTEKAVVIADKFPKALHHYLVLPKEDINNIFQLGIKHLPLLEELHLLARNIVEIRGKCWDNFLVGFHAKPSMHRLHLHVISKDLNSSFLKTKKHWNSFTTALFIPFENLYENLSTNGCITRFPKHKVDELLAKPLVCNQCEYNAKNMSSLKKHLLTHLAV